jgi:hypothetical protein
MNERDLVAIGFQPRGDGALVSPARVVLSREGEFFRVSIELPGNAVLSFHISKRALKVCKGEKA